MSKLLLLISLITLHTSYATEGESTCYGTSEKGSLVDGVQLPLAGTNFSAYSQLGYDLGRTYVHHQVSQILVKAYEELTTLSPQTKYVYGETGFKKGGVFEPHKTHQNGTSVDFMVPVKDGTGASLPLPCTSLNKWCYSIEFNKKGQFENYAIDFDAITKHLAALVRHSDAAGISIRRIIFDPDLSKLLKNSPAWKEKPVNITFSQHKPWVRHDEHYHIDFNVPCK